MGYFMEGMFFWVNIVIVVGGVLGMIVIVVVIFFLWCVIKIFVYEMIRMVEVVV